MFAILTLVLLLHVTTAVLLFAALLLLRRPLRCTDKVIVAAMYSGTQKTIGLGIPIIHEVFAGRPDLGLLVIPLLLFHPIQIILGSILAPYIKSHIKSLANPREEVKDEDILVDVSLSPIHQ